MGDNIDSLVPEKTAGTKGPTEGFHYEIQMQAYILLNLRNNCDNFSFAVNLKDGEKFDDVMFTFEKEQKWHTYFIQIKHKADVHNKSRKIKLADLKKGKDFGLPMYYESFLKIKDKFNKCHDQVFFNRDYENLKLVLFTSAIFNDNLKDKKRIVVDSDQLDLISTQNDSELNVQFKEDVDVDIFSSIEGAEKKEFFDKLYFCSGQKEESQMDEIVKRELMKWQDMTETEAQTVKNQFYEILRKNGQTPLIDRKMVDKFLYQSGFPMLWRKGIGIAFETDFLNKLERNFSDTNEIYALVSSSKKTSLCISALMKIKPKMQEINVNRIDEKWEGDADLMISCDDGPHDVRTAAKIIRNLKRKHFIFLVMTEANRNAGELAKEVGAKSVNFECSFANLEPNCRELFLKRKMLFQDQLVEFGQIVENEESLFDKINCEILTNLLESFECGKKPSEEIPIYINREIQRFHTVDRNFLDKKKVKCIYALSGRRETIQRCADFHLASAIFKRKSADSSTRYVYLDGDDPSRDFFRLTHEFLKQETVHWLAYDDKQWFWKDSWNGVYSVFIGTCASYFTTDGTSTEKKKNILSLDSKMVVLSAEPGMGKSTLVTHMEKQIKKEKPDFWMIRLTFNDHTEWFKNNPKPNEQQIKQLIQAVAVRKEAAEFEKELFDYYYLKTGKIILLMDGFDEICPWHSESAYETLKVLKHSKVSQIWVTTRPVMKQELQERLFTVAFEIKPFEEKDQRMFFEKFWNTNNDPNVREFIKKVLELVKASFNEDCNKFTGIPLQTKMLAEVFNEHFEQFQKNKEIRLPERISILYLFEEFVKKKFKIFLHEKVGLTDSKPTTEENSVNILLPKKEEHMTLALITLLPGTERAKLGIVDDLIQKMTEEIKKGKNREGIITDIEQGIPRWIHRTFAEHFAALFFYEKSPKETVKRFLESEYFFSEEFKMVRFMFDRMLAKGRPVHNAILDSDDKQFQDLYSKEGINERDEGGRSLLHLAAMQPNAARRIKMLIDDGADVKARDQILDFMPIQYAIRRKLSDNVAVLVSQINPEDIYRLADELIHLDKNLILFNVIKTDSVDALRVLLEREGSHFPTMVTAAIGPTPTDVDDLTLVHLAAYHGSLKTLQYLLKNEKYQEMINSPDGNLNTPLHYALHCSQEKQIRVIRELFEHGAVTPKGNPLTDIFKNFEETLRNAVKGYRERFQLL